MTLSLLFPSRAMLAAILIIAAPDSLTLRDTSSSASPLTGKIHRVDDAGVLFSSLPTEQPTLYTWDRVRDLRSDDASLQKSFGDHRAFADSLWRARSRIERGDTASAQPILDILAPSIIGRTDESALVAMEGLLRCRLARDARPSAVIPFLETTRLIRAGVRRTAYLDLPNVVDPRTGLCPVLPPVWSPDPALESLVAELDSYQLANSPAVQNLSRLYRLSALRALDAASANQKSAPGAAPPPHDSDISLDPSARPDEAFVAAIVAASSPIASQRTLAIQTLSRFVDAADWQAAWARFGRGSALLDSPDLDDQRRGLVDLLTLPALFDQSSPYLAAIALDSAAIALDSMNRSADADSLRRDLADLFPARNATAPFINTISSPPPLPPTEPSQ